MVLFKTTEIYLNSDDKDQAIKILTGAYNNIKEKKVYETFDYLSF